MKIRNGFVSNSSSSSFSVIGVKISMDSLYQTVTRRTCDCEVDNIENLKFCPECGKKAMKTFKDPVDFFEDEYSIGGFEVEECPEYSNNSGHAIVIIPDTRRCVCDFDEYAVKKIPDNLNELKQKLIFALEPLGLWNENDYGIWTAMCGG